MSDTPRTDGWLSEAIDGHDFVEHCRQLERELADASELLKEMYVFVAMRHKATQPWRNALDEWQKKVEALTGWSDYETIKDWRQTSE